MNDFIKIAKRNNDIKVYSECYDSDPYLLEEEKINFYIGEEVTKYGRYDIGDIVFVKKCNDNAKVDNHLFVIVDDDNRGIPLNYFCMVMSSNVEKVKYATNSLVLKDNKNHLKYDSIVKTDVIYNMKHDDISFTIGTISLKLIEKYKKLYMEGKIKSYE